MNKFSTFLTLLLVASSSYTAVAGAGAVGNATLIDDATPTVPTTTLPPTVQATAVDQTVVLSPVQEPDTATADLAATLSAIVTADMRQRSTKLRSIEKQMLELMKALADLHAAWKADLGRANNTTDVLQSTNTNAPMGLCCFWQSGNLAHPDSVLVPPADLALYVLRYPLTGRAARPINIPKPGGGKGGRHLLAEETGEGGTSADVAADTSDVATVSHMPKTTSPPPFKRTSSTHTSQVHVPLRGRPAAGAHKLAAAATTKG